MSTLNPLKLGPIARGKIWIARLGLMVLAWLVVGFGTSIPLLLGRRGMWDPETLPILVAVHIYASTASIAFIAAKTWGSWGLLGNAPPNRLAPAPDRVASGALVVLMAVLYASGILLVWDIAPGGNRWIKDAHLYATIASLIPITLHLIRHLGPSWRLILTGSRARQPRGSETPLYSRRGLVALAVVATLAFTVRRLLPSNRIEDPNDFPITNFGLTSTPLDPATWQLTISGEVEQPFSLSYPEILKMPRERHRFPLDCVTGWSATREWEGVPISKLLAMARPNSPDCSLSFISSTGYEVMLTARWHSQPGALVATHVGGVPFTHDHGFPLRIMVPGVVGEQNVKWLREIKVLKPATPSTG